MARKKKTPIMTCTDLAHVDQRLKRLGEIQIALSDIEGQMTLAINDIKEMHEAQIDALKLEQTGIEKGIEAYAEDHKEQFVEGRTKELTYGKIAYKVTRSIRIAAKETCLMALRAAGLGHMIRTKEEPDKVAMAVLDDVELVKMGAKRTVKDSFRIEPNIEKIKKEAA